MRNLRYIAVCLFVALPISTNVNANNPQINKCKTTKAYKFYTASWNVVDGLGSMKISQRQLDRENAIANNTGVVNLTNKYKYGNLLEFARERVQTNFEMYKSLGGSASTPEGVTLIKNPCQ